MSDPFRPEANQQLLREARVGLTLLAITLGTFVYVAYYRISGNGQQLPDYVVNAPIAEAVWPGENPLPLAEKNPAPQTLGSQFGSLLASAQTSFRSIRNRRLRPGYDKRKAITKIRSRKRILRGSPKRSCPSERNPMPLNWQLFEAILRLNRTKTVSRRKYPAQRRRNRRSITMNCDPREQSPTPQLTLRLVLSNKLNACHSSNRRPYR